MHRHVSSLNDNIYGRHTRRCSGVLAMVSFLFIGYETYTRFSDLAWSYGWEHWLFCERRSRDRLWVSVSCWMVDDLLSDGERGNPFL